LYKADGTITDSSVTTTGRRLEYASSYENEEEGQGDFCILNNIIPDGIQRKNGWFKMGYQSRPGSLIVVNGEPIVVGRSGIYEINNGTLIKSFMIATPGGSDSSKIDAFLLDYAYDNEEKE
jgi:hypothetical protein